MMPSSTKANKWSAKLIIVFQLTIWSTVGIILFQRGAISLYGKAEARNDTADGQEWFARRDQGNESVEESTIKETLHRRVKQEIATRRGDIAPDKLEGATQNGQWAHSRMYSSHRTVNIGPITVERKQDTRDIRAIQAQATVGAADKHGKEKLNHNQNVILSFPSHENPLDSKETVAIVNETSSVLFQLKNSSSTTNLCPSSPDKTIEHVKAENKSQSSPVNRIGAAIAIVMLAIGVVMLLLGPLIVILRAFGDRRRTRQMLKSRYRNDQPPTYEEATAIMDEAPRYSTLQLDMILDASSSL
ncbi:uncharacterized protein LOC143374314 [Andrena cerasifolii]|uniref:uncharacterized protein LOC143374314 n=1 Tax=Andrena cerasifolii TaxID=2819439 RepID=UPI0040377DF1